MSRRDHEPGSARAEAPPTRPPPSRGERPRSWQDRLGNRGVLAMLEARPAVALAPDDPDEFDYLGARLDYPAAPNAYQGIQLLYAAEGYQTEGLVSPGVVDLGGGRGPGYWIAPYLVPGTEQVVHYTA